MCSVYGPRERERERNKIGGWEGGVERERVKERGIGGRETGEARSRESPANHEAGSCYVIGEGGTEENRAQISEICCTDARMSRIPKQR